MHLTSETEESTSAVRLADPDIIARMVESIPPQTLSGWEADLLERAAIQAQQVSEWEADFFHFTGTERERLSSLARIYLGETIEWK